MSAITKERIELFIKNQLDNGLTRGEQMEVARIALASLTAASDERAAYELFMEKRFGDSVDRRRAKNGDREYMAWDMALGWIIWCHRAAMLQGAENTESRCTIHTAPELDSSPKISESRCGNSPVTPDGWVMVPEEPTPEMLEAGDEQFGTYDVYRRMLAAAPQKEAINGKN